MTSDEITPPHPTGKPLEQVSLTGLLFPWQDNAPVFLGMPLSPHLYLPCFRTAEQLRKMMAEAKVPFATIKQIEDERDFLASFPRASGTQEIKVIVDPYFTEEGRVRFIEIKWN